MRKRFGDSDVRAMAEPWFVAICRAYFVLLGIDGISILLALIGALHLAIYE